MVTGRLKMGNHARNCLLSIVNMSRKIIKKCYQWLLLIDAILINAKQMLRYCFLDNSSKEHAHWLLTLMILRNFISLQSFIVYTENSLRFEISLRSNWLHPRFTLPDGEVNLITKALVTNWLLNLNQNLYRIYTVSTSWSKTPAATLRILQILLLQRKKLNYS